MIVVSAMSQVDLTGKVLDSKSNPVSGVVATLESLGLTDTTGADGVYHFGATGIKETHKSNFPVFKMEGRKIIMILEPK